MTRAGDVVPGRCAEHGGLMWSNAMRVCITPDDVMRGGCRWTPLSPEAIGMEPTYDTHENRPTYAEAADRA